MENEKNKQRLDVRLTVRLTQEQYDMTTYLQNYLLTDQSRSGIIRTILEVLFAKYQEKQLLDQVTE